MRFDLFPGYRYSKIIDLGKYSFAVNDILFFAGVGLTGVMDNREIARRARQMDYYTEDDCRRLLVTMVERSSYRSTITAKLSNQNISLEYSETAYHMTFLLSVYR